MNQQHCFTDALRSAESVQDSQGAAGTENDKVIYTNYKYSVMTPDNDKMAEKNKLHNHHDKCFGELQIC